MKRILALVLTLSLVFMVASCGKISESYAKKINAAADKGEHYSYDQVVEDLGDNAIEIAFLGTGVVIAVKGCESVADIKAKIEDGKTVKGIVVTMLANKAMSASYREITKDDLK